MNLLTKIFYNKKIINAFFIITIILNTIIIFIEHYYSNISLGYTIFSSFIFLTGIIAIMLNYNNYKKVSVVLLILTITFNVIEGYLYKKNIFNNLFFWFCIILFIKFIFDIIKNKSNIFNASYNGDLKTIKNYIKKGGDINIKNNNGYTALMYSSGNGYVDCVKLLIEAKADINAKANDCGTALIIASDKGQTDCVKLLIDAKADVNAKNNDGFTALMLATFKGRTDCIKFLIDAKADVNAKNNNDIILFLKSK